MGSSRLDVLRGRLAVALVTLLDYGWRMGELHLRRPLPRRRHWVAMRLFQLFGRTFPVTLTNPNPLRADRRPVSLCLDLCQNHELYVRSRGRYELEWVKLVAAGLDDAETFVDVGANVGLYSLTIAHAFPDRGVMGSMAVEGPILKWAANHRRHHQHSDREDDPHTPHGHGEGARAFLLGLYHAHLGWLFAPDAPDLHRYVPDLASDGLVRRLSAWFPLWAVLGLLIPAGIAWAITGTWTGAFLGLLWGGLVRVLLVHHLTWSINSVCHLWGTRPYRTHDHSRNNAVFGVLGMGEGWHNNHHAFPASARHGLHWWQLDVSYLVIRALSLVGLASEVRVPSPARVAAKSA